MSHSWSLICDGWLCLAAAFVLRIFAGDLVYGGYDIAGMLTVVLSIVLSSTGLLLFCLSRSRS